MWTDSCVSICEDKQPMESGECFGGELRLSDGGEKREGVEKDEISDSFDSIG